MGRVKAKTAETEKSGRVNGRGAEGTNESSRRMGMSIHYVDSSCIPKAK